MPIQLPKAAYSWAIRHLTTEGDSDLFPRSPELAALKYNWNHGVLEDLSQLDLSTYAWKGGRRLLVPKNVLAFRQGTQLHPLDSVVFAAFMKSIGRRLERHRMPLSDDRVFSYRYAPTSDGRFYGTDTRWSQFWEVSRKRAEQVRCTHVLTADISDFYNQIYHHVIENQLRESGLPEAHVQICKRFLSAYSETVSRGIPIGPHSVHLLAELSLHPVDLELRGKGYDFCRYVDDVHVFCGSEEEATGALYDLANTLDAQQRLVLERSKTRIVPAQQLKAIADRMLIDQPINEEEQQLLDVIAGHTDDDPYAHISLGQLTDEELELLSPDLLSRLLETYLDESPRNYSRVGWLLRRLRQVGAPGAIMECLYRLDILAPVMGDVARYIMASLGNHTGNGREVGELIAGRLQLPVVARSAYLKVLLLDIIASVPELNHADAVTAMYDSEDPVVRREVLRVAASHGCGAWLRGRKHEFRGMDAWSRIAFLYGLPVLPGDEAEHWLREIRITLSPLERLVVRHAFKDRTKKVGETALR